MTIIQELKELLDKLNGLDKLDYEAANNLIHDCKILVKFLYPEGSEHLSILNQTAFKPTGMIYNKGHHAYDDHWESAKITVESVLETCVKELHLQNNYPEFMVKSTGEQQWYKRPFGIVLLTVIAGIIVMIIRYYFWLGEQKL